MDFLSTFIIVLFVVVLAVPGFVLRKAKLFSDGASKVLASLLLYVTQPFLMVYSLLKYEFEKSMLVNFLWVILFAVVLQLVIFFISKLLFLKSKDIAGKRVCEAASFMGNVGFMGIPVMQQFFPENAELIVYTVAYNIVFNAMSWTLGIYTVTGEKKNIKPWKVIVNPPTIASILVLPLFFLNVSLPSQILTTCSYLGEMTLPLSMIILGVRLADIKLKKLFCNLKVYIVAFLKLVVSPLASLGILLLVNLAVPLESNVILMLFVVAAMPTASSVLNFAERYGGDQDTAAASTLMTTLLCVITVPLLMLLCNLVI